jgi:hypothetical protein
MMIFSFSFCELSKQKCDLATGRPQRRVAVKKFLAEAKQARPLAPSLFIPFNLKGLNVLIEFEDVLVVKGKVALDQDKDDHAETPDIDLHDLNQTSQRNRSRKIKNSTTI